MSGENEQLRQNMAEIEFEKASFKNRFEFQSKNLLEKSSNFSHLSRKYQFKHFDVDF